MCTAKDARPSEIEKARRRINRSASKKGHKTRAATLLLSEWIIVLTTIPPTELSAEVILELYRIRWQIELYIKRLKSILQLGKIRAKLGSPLAKVQILAKMLYAVLLEQIAEKRLGVGWTVMTSFQTRHLVPHLEADARRIHRSHHWYHPLARVGLALPAQSLGRKKT